jgi:hypothetical protein
MGPRSAHYTEVRRLRAISRIVDGYHQFFVQGRMTAIVPGSTENLETFQLGGRFHPSIVHFSRRIDEIKTFFRILSV